MRGGRAKTGLAERDAVNRTSSRQKIAARNIFLPSAGSILTCVRSHHPGVIPLIFEIITTEGLLWFQMKAKLTAAV
jgi:hypothetical protein